MGPLEELEIRHTAVDKVIRILEAYEATYNPLPVRVRIGPEIRNLTFLQRQVAVGLWIGLSAARIGREIGISTQAVYAQIRTLYGRAQVHCRADFLAML